MQVLAIACGFVTAFLALLTCCGAGAGTDRSMRHLSPDQAVAALRRGKPVEQILESVPHEGRPTVRWLTISPVGFALTAQHVYDEGSPEFLDVSEFSPVDDEE